MRFVEVRDPAGIARVAEYYAEVWKTTELPVPTEVLHSIHHSGGSVIAAFDGDRVVAATAAMFGRPGDHSVYSMIAAAESGLGHPLKLAQRDWALKHGATTMRWLFDPLVARNARFNLVKLGAVVTEYLVDFYGSMNDGVNDGDESDRLTASWDLTASPSARPEQEPNGTVTRAAPDGEALEIRGDNVIWCRVPSDVVSLRLAEPAVALQWRHAVREVFTTAFAAGYRATSMSRAGWYRLENL